MIGAPTAIHRGLELANGWLDLNYAEILEVARRAGRFPQLVSLGLRPAKSHENRGAVRMSPRERRDRIEPVEPLRPSNCLIRSVRD
jgi:hypothetical protein